MVFGNPPGLGSSPTPDEGRGLHAALDHAARALTRTGWFFKVDISRYYDSIPHALLLRRLARRFRERRLLALWAALLASHGGPCGLPIGALTSQYLGNFYLDAVDHLLLKTPGIRSYSRYMDDILMIGSREVLLEARDRLHEALAGLGLALKHGGVPNRCVLGVPEDEARARAASVFAHAGWATDLGWRRTVCRIWDTPGPAPRPPRRLVHQHGHELPLGRSQQEAPWQPQQEPGFPPGFGPRHGGAVETPPDDACSSAGATAPDKTKGKTSPPAESCHTADAEKATKAGGEAPEEKSTP